MSAPFPKEARTNWVDGVAGAGGVNLYVQLVKADFTLNEDTTYLGLTIADFAGYAPYNSAGWAAPALDTNGDIFILSPVVVWNKAVGTPTNNIYGWVTSLGVGIAAKMVQVGKFATPLSMVLATDVIARQFKIALRDLTS